MTKKEKILMSAVTLLCPPVGLITWFNLYKVQEQYADELGNLITKGFGSIAEALKPLESKKHKEDA